MKANPSRELIIVLLLCVGDNGTERSAMLGINCMVGALLKWSTDERERESERDKERGRENERERARERERFGIYVFLLSSEEF